MGEVFNALETMNRTLRLGLSPSQLLGAEMGFKSALARVSNPDPTRGLPQDPVALAQGYEMVVKFQPRAQKLTLAQLSAFATQTVGSPRISVDAKVATDIATAIQHANVAAPSTTIRQR